MGGAPPDDDDPPEADWFAVKTEADAPRLPVPATTRDPVTAPHPITGDVAAAFESGRRQGFTDGARFGQHDAVDALVRIVHKHFGNDPVLRHLVAAVRQEMTPI